ncbi:hypothetical protein D7V82_00750 [bacterium 1xD8-6]|nr:hypothetical protein D7V72_00745 [bacterium D16-36]RKI73364.1 hypothetical protein D7V82_00750 [bacterium 1xD8-6]
MQDGGISSSIPALHKVGRRFCKGSCLLYYVNRPEGIFMKVQRGEFGYIRARKRRALLGTVWMAVIGIAVFLTGLFLNKMSNRNIFTVLAVLFVLPGAKFLVAYIVTFPYHSVGKERYDKVQKNMPEGMALYTDLVITSPEKVMHLDFAVVGNGHVICLLGQRKQEISYVRKYLTDGVHNWGSGYKVKVVDSEKKFLGELAGVKPCEVDEEEEKNVKSYLISLIV